MTNDTAEIKQRAETIGLTKLTDYHLEQLARATQSAAQRKQQLTIELEIADEPSHVFRAKEESS